MSEKFYVKTEVIIWLNYGVKWYNNFNGKIVLKPKGHLQIYFTQRVVLYSGPILWYEHLSAFLMVIIFKPAAFKAFKKYEATLIYQMFVK
jgi:hypothetical protein